MACDSPNEMVFSACSGIPCLLMRKATERQEGLGENAVLSHYDPAVIRRFTLDFASHRQPGFEQAVRPSDVIIDDRVSMRTEETVSSSLDLQATMIGTANKLANVDGRILKPGDEIQGHVLVAVHERYAVFRRNGKNTTVHVKPQLAENDE